MTLFKLLLMSLRAFLYLDILIHIHSFIFILPLSLLLLLFPSPPPPPSSVTHYPCGFSAAVTLSEKMLTYSCPSFLSCGASFEDQMGVNAC